MSVKRGVGSLRSKRSRTKRTKFGQRVPSFSSKRGHVTVKHVLTGRKHDKLGNQTFEVLQLLKRTVHTPFTYFTYWLSSRHLNYFISEILGQRNTWFEVSAVFVYRKHRKLSKLWCESLLNGRQTSNVTEHVMFEPS